MLTTKFGPPARNGDYVLVVDFHYMKRRCETYVARVYRDKAYTGAKNSSTGRYIHKLNAETIIPADYVPEDQKRKIIEDIVLHNGDIVRQDIERGVLW